MGVTLFKWCTKHRV